MVFVSKRSVQLLSLAGFLSFWNFMCLAGLPDSGIVGQLTIGPLGPVERPGTINYRPYEGTVIVLDQEEKMVTQFRSGPDGSFRISLKPGTYTLHPESAVRPYPRAAKQIVKVSNGQFTQVRINYDTGIR